MGLLGDKPIIGIILDENTSQGGASYDTGKSYFKAIEKAGGVAVGLPYAADSLEFARQQCAGLMSTGARIKFPSEWYVHGQESYAPQSDRFAIERALVEAFLAEDRPYFGICNGMQMLGCLSGCRMSGDAKSYTDGSIAHDDRTTRHGVKVTGGTKLHTITGLNHFHVNSFHREALVEISDQVVISAYSDDGLVEAIERPDRRFVMGVQWHPERLIEETPDAAALFQAFVTAAYDWAKAARLQPSAL
ncbi:gamma-glutamyl-gamma-aminobutyrate hydrolase family protein [Aquidulcibacter paucihalophilus]|uniref:gamma-glutamyl-gamma-aminobutyrate hydrolase family protein n=1 Tax=Aquidulcibacter paucihalophilus TaxID=1978549 RepID=UPI000A1947E2|nr:gamma-glutamyl-gamma-aminobutyrate hydrolase family protein [Aquidulcibacter paucihalophilus]